MDFQLKQWTTQEEQQHPFSTKLPRFFLDSYNKNNNNNESEQEESVLPLSLFVPEQPTSKISSSNLSAAYFPDSTPVTATKYPRMGSYFSLAQWQELELQALIFRHMLAGSPVPPELLHLVKKSLLASSSYYLPNNIQHYPYFHQSMLQSGYWGRGAMDPEPGRCRRTDGKKWRCSRDIVSGHKYCERHVHRGKNRSRKPVEIPTPTAASTGGNAGGGIEKTDDVSAAMAAVRGGMAHSRPFGPSSSVDLLHINGRSLEPTISLKNPFETQGGDYPNDGKSSDRILRPFFDDWPSRSLHQSDNVGSGICSVASTTNLSITTPGNASDFSLKLSTGSNTDNPSRSTERDQFQASQWSVPTWGTNQVASMGGPLAEALRSSTNSSPTSVLFQLPDRTRSHSSYVSS